MLDCLTDLEFIRHCENLCDKANTPLPIHEEVNELCNRLQCAVNELEEQSHTIDELEAKLSALEAPV